MGLRNGVMALGALGMLVWTHPAVMLQVLLVLVLLVVPAMVFGRRVRRLSRASQDRVADTSAIAGEILNAIPVVQAYTAERHETARFAQASAQSFATAVRRSRARALLVAFIIIATSAALLWGLYQGTQAVLAGQMSPGELGQTVVYVIILAGASAVLGEIYGELLRAAGATERLMELLDSPSPVRSDESLPSPPPAAQPQPLPITFDQVVFHYPSRPQVPALDGFTLHIAAGETVALVGASGAGKSTVFQLLQRFYDTQEGQIAIGGQALDSISLHHLSLIHI